jgi:hypothetical protein
LSTTTIQIRRDTDANWAAANPILADGEIAFLKTSKLAKIGNGVTPFNSLPYWVLASAESGESNTASISTSSTGTGQIFKEKSGVDLVFKGIKAGANIVLNNDTDDLVISATSTLSNLDGTFEILNTADNTKIIDFDASDITTGTTRTITMADKNINLSEMATVITIEDVSILSASWTDDTATSGYWLYDYANVEITANDSVDAIFALTSLEDAEKVLKITDSSTGSVRLYATAQPTENLTCDIRIIKGVVI